MSQNSLPFCPSRISVDLLDVLVTVIIWYIMYNSVDPMISLRINCFQNKAPTMNFRLGGRIEGCTVAIYLHDFIKNTQIYVSLPVYSALAN